MGKITVKDADEVPKKGRAKFPKKSTKAAPKKTPTKKPAKKISITVRQDSSEGTPVPVVHEEHAAAESGHSGEDEVLAIDSRQVDERRSEPTTIDTEPEDFAEAVKIEEQLSVAVEEAVRVADNHQVIVNDKDDTGTSNPSDIPASTNADQSTPKPKGIAAYKPIVFTPAPAPEIEAPVEMTLPEAEESVIHSTKKSSRLKISRKLALLTCLGLVSGIILLAILAPTRNFALSLIGVTGSASIKVVDSETQMPIKGAVITYRTQTYSTDKDGNAFLSSLRLGDTTVDIKKAAFAASAAQVKVRYGGTATQQISITPNGKRIKFKLVDYVGNKPVSGAEITARDFAAYSDKDGAVSLAVDANIGTPLEVTIQAAGYRNETRNIQPLPSEEIKMELVPRQKHYYIGSNSGRYDIMSIDIDGKNKSTVLQGTGAEKEDTHIIQQQSGQHLAVITSRSGLAQSTGVYVYNVSNSQLKLLNGAERARIIGWIDDWLVYSYIDPSKPKNSPEKELIIAYNSKNETQSQLASANYFNDIALVGANILYAPSSSQLGAAKAKLYEVHPSKKSNKMIIDQEIWKISWKDQNTVLASGTKDQFAYTYKTGGVTKSKSAEAKISNLVLSPNSQQAVYVDTSSSSKKLIATGGGIQNKNVLFESAALTPPVRWLSGGYIVFRQTTTAGTADYVIASSGGSPIKIATVASTGVLDDWYFH